MTTLGTLNSAFSTRPALAKIADGRTVAPRTGRHTTTPTATSPMTVTSGVRALPPESSRYPRSAAAAASPPRRGRRPSEAGRLAPRVVMGVE